MALKMVAFAISIVVLVYNDGLPYKISLVSPEAYTRSRQPFSQ